ncbi:hypothetical protein BRC62_05700 [Halobacteriales archaeon QH_10_67_13]|nr:MAG: hypothetical protein BRC62_05700 [Halobacteriales archaeon QH_10_67_13]
MTLPNVQDRLETLARRREYLDALAETPRCKRDLVEELGDSRSTVDRAIDELVEAGFVERPAQGYVPTQSGRAALSRYRSFLADAGSIVDAQPVVDAVPPEHDLPVELVADGRVVPVDGEYELFSWVTRLVRAVEDCRIVWPQLGDSRHVRLWHDVTVRGDTTVELLAPEPVLEQLGTEFPELGTDLAAADSFTARTIESSPFGLVLADEPVALADSGASGADDSNDSPSPPSTTAADAGTGTVLVPVFDDEAAGVLTSTDDAAVAWGRTQYRRLRAEGSPGDDRLAGGDGTGLSAVSTGLPAQLREDGFVRVDEAYFERREPLSPAAAWCAGLGLPEVAAGYAVERITDDGRRYADAIADRLTDGENVALVGPPGTGKSTLCRQVAYRWTDRGTVLYRDGDSPEPFESVAALSRAIDRAPTPVLVVVEDLLRPDARAAIELVERTTGRDEVVFLADARKSEWHATNTELDVRRDAIRQDAFEVLAMPRLDETDVRRFVERGESLLETDISADPETLLTEIRATDSEGPAPGGVLLLLNRLARLGDPAGEVDNVLDADVDAVREDLAAEGETALAAGILANALNAAGLEVHDELLYALAVADPEESGTDDRIHQVEAALDRLRGHVLFSRPDERGYRGIHESWSVRFLTRLLETTDEHRARERFGTAVSALLALADESARCDRIAELVAGTTPALEQIAADPTGWADRVAEALFEVGETTPALAPLYGSTNASGPALPAACSSRAEGRCLRARGRMQTVAGAYDRAAAEFERLLTLAEAADCESLTAEATAQLGRVERERGEFEAATERFETAVDRAGTADDPRIEAMGLDGRMRGDADDARAEYERALEISREIGDRHEEAQALTNLGIIAHRTGEYDRARDRYEAALSIQHEIGDKRGRAKSLYSLGVIAQNRNETDSARDRYEAALGLYREIGDAQWEARTLQALASLNRRRGAYRQSREQAERAVELFETIGDAQGKATALAGLGTIAYQRGAYERAREYYTERLSLVRETDDRRGELNAIYSLGVVALAQNLPSEARERLESALAIARELEDPQEAACLRSLAALAREEDAFDRAADRIESARGVLDRFDDPTRRGKLAVESARLSLDRGELSAAREHVATATDVFDESETPYWYGRACRLRGTVAAERTASGPRGCSRRLRQRSLIATVSGSRPIWRRPPSSRTTDPATAPD